MFFFYSDAGFLDVADIQQMLEQALALICRFATHTLDPGRLHEPVFHPTAAPDVPGKGPVPLNIRSNSRLGDNVRIHPVAKGIFPVARFKKNTVPAAKHDGADFYLSPFSQPQNPGKFSGPIRGIMASGSKGFIR